MGAQPSAARITAACLAASAAAAAPTLLLGVLAVIAFPIGLMVAGAHMALLGLPAYLVLRRYRAVEWGHALTAGFVIGFAPVALLEVIATSLQDRVASYGPGVGYSFGTWLIAGGLGLLAGAVFRAVIGRPADPRSEREIAAVFD